jgi:hypothetical protein
LIISQNNQEHSLALEYLDAQLEALRYASALPPGQVNIPTAGYFCLYLNGAGINSVDFSPPNTTKPLSQQGYNSNCEVPGNSFNYYVAIIATKNQAQGNTIAVNYDASIKWNGLGALGVQSEDLNYRVYVQ